MTTFLFIFFAGTPPCFFTGGTQKGITVICINKLMYCYQRKVHTPQLIIKSKTYGGENLRLYYVSHIINTSKHVLECRAAKRSWGGGGGGGRGAGQIQKVEPII